MLETSQLQTLVAVAKAGSFSRAAEDLRVTQSAISQSMRNLEKKVGLKLFSRDGSRVVLTSTGVRLCRLGEEFLSDMRDVLDEFDNEQNGLMGKVRIGTLNGIGKSWLGAELIDFSKECKEVTVSVKLGLSDDLVRLFKNRHLDFVILPEEGLPTVGERHFLGEEYSVFVYPKTPEFNLRPQMGPQEIAAYPTILFDEEEDGLYKRWFHKRFGVFPEKINRRYVINSHGNMLQAVREGLGVAVVPFHVLRRSRNRHLLGSFDDLKVGNGKFYVAHHEDLMELPRMRLILERIIGSFNPLS